jgi:hypothetical protein
MPVPQRVRLRASIRSVPICWIAGAASGAPKGIWRFPDSDGAVQPLPAVDDARRIGELERKIGQLTMENDF